VSKRGTFMSRRRNRWVGALALLAVVAAGCSSDDTTSGTSDGAATTEVDSTTVATEVDDTAVPTSEATTAVTTGDTEPATTESVADEAPAGEPIKFMAATAVGGVVAQPEIFDGVDAAVAAINGAGGIPDPAGGPNRPLEVMRCEAGAGGNVDPDVALRCAQDSIEQGVIAVVGKYLFGADGTQAWAQAGIPMLGTSPVETEDFLNELVFPLSGGAITGGPGLGIALQEAGAETVALVTGDVEAGRQLPALMSPGLAAEDDLVQEVYVPLDPSADYTPQLSQLVSANPDGIAVFGSSDINVRVIAGLRSAGYTGLIAVPGTGLTPEGIEVLGEAAEGVLMVSGFEAATGDSDAIGQFNAEMEATAPDAPRTELAINAWASVHLFAEVLSELPTIDSASVVAALNNRPVDLGVAPPFTLGVPDNPLGLPRVFRVTFQVQEISGGEIVPSGDGAFLDVNDFVTG
jgi:ABC-type branched-subunit amino acid transport system substrate-binding protein